MKNKTVIIKEKQPIANITTAMVIVLIILKLFGGVNIGWLWVFAPYWIPLGLVILILLLVLFCTLIVIGIDMIKTKKRMGKYIKNK